MRSICVLPRENQLSNTSDLEQTTEWGILRIWESNNITQLVPILSRADKIYRVDVNIFLDMKNPEPDSYTWVLFSDLAAFCVNGHINKRRCVHVVYREF